MAAKFAVLLPHLDERQRRLVLGAEARALGHGGIKAVAEAAGMSTVTVSRGVSELTADGKPLGRVRRPGGGRKPVTATNPGLQPALLALMEPAGPPAPLRWTTKSTRQLARALAGAGHQVSPPTVAKLLRADGFRLQGKPTEGSQQRDRDAQFRQVLDRVVDHLRAGEPVICLDAEAGDEIARFAVGTLRDWWQRAGRSAYPRARRLLVTGNAIGSGNGTTDGGQDLVWTVELANFGSEAGLSLTVCPLPSGTCKWAAVEHRALANICVPVGGALVSHEVSIQAVSAGPATVGESAAE